MSYPLMNTTIFSGAQQSSAPPITLDRLMAVTRQMKREFPALPKADPRHCMKCKEEMSNPAMAVGGGPEMLCGAVGYLCGSCAYQIKKMLFYDRRNEAIRAVEG